MFHDPSGGETASWMGWWITIEYCIHIPIASANFPTKPLPRDHVFAPLWYHVKIGGVFLPTGNPPTNGGFVNHGFKLFLIYDRNVEAANIAMKKDDVRCSHEFPALRPNV